MSTTPTCGLVYEETIVEGGTCAGLNVCALYTLSRDNVVRDDNVYSSLYIIMGIGATPFLVTQDMETMHQRGQGWSPMDRHMRSG